MYTVIMSILVAAARSRVIDLLYNFIYMLLLLLVEYTTYMYCL